MKKQTINYFSTGEFAKLCGVSKQTIIYYDKIGLLQPTRIEANGYRYYSVQQVEQFAVIDLLKRLDTPLKDIQYFLHEHSLDEAIRWLTEKKRELKKKIQELQHLTTVIETKQKLIACAAKATENITFEQMEEERLAVSTPIVAANDKDLSKQIMEFVQQFKLKAIDAGYPISRFITFDQFQRGNYTMGGRLYIPIHQPSEMEELVKPAGKYVIAYHIGSYSSIPKTYHRLKQWLEEQKLSIEGNVYEQYMLDEIVPSETDQYVTKIHAKIATTSST